MLPRRLSGFQFHKGTIKPEVRKKVRLLYTNFNSIKVRLNLPSRVTYLMSAAYFNSIKVRLNLRTKKANTVRRKFQFHKGTIKPILG